MSKKKSISSLLVLSTLAIASPSAVLASGGSSVKPKPLSSFHSIKTIKNPQIGEIVVKCAGIVKKGMNHCGANGHGCTGLSADDASIQDFDKEEWIYVREEVCKATPGNIVGRKIITKG